MLLVTRREGRLLRRYGHLSTGNYNERTAKLYTDLGYLTADAAMTADMDGAFNHMASQNRPPKLRKLLLAPFYLHKRLIQKITQVGIAASQGKGGRIVAKMNALTDEALIRALMLAGQQGAKIDLIVRGACMLAAQVPGVTDNIRVRSVIGRFLEHTRVFYFLAGQQEELYLSSADWMNRNMLRRMELAWPVTDPVLRQQIVDECLVAYLHDDRNAWTLQADGTYLPPPRSVDGLGAQRALMQKYAPAGSIFDVRKTPSKRQKTDRPLKGLTVKKIRKILPVVTESFTLVQADSSVLLPPVQSTADVTHSAPLPVDQVRNLADTKVTQAEGIEAPMGNQQSVADVQVRQHPSNSDDTSHTPNEGTA